jgi:ketosteroid isomerase-like protein
MTERATIESILKDAYAARLRGDVEGMVRHFADDAVFALAGAREASPVALRCSDCDSMRAAMAGLVGAFEFKSHEIVALVVEGDRAVAHTRVRVRAAATGEEAVTEMADIVTFENGKIKSFLEFCDTALAAKMAAGTVVA